MRHRVVIYERHVLDVEADSPEEATHIAEGLHEEADGAYYDNAWVESIEPLPENRVRRLDPVD